MIPASPVIPSREAPEVEIAKTQQEYLTLPSLRTADGIVLSRWLLTDEEKRLILEQGYLYISVLTFNHKLQPIRPTADIPPEFANTGVPANEDWPEEIEGV